jgi:hypothetical protein
MEQNLTNARPRAALAAPLQGMLSIMAAGQDPKLRQAALKLEVAAEAMAQTHACYRCANACWWTAPKANRDWASEVSVAERPIQLDLKLGGCKANVQAGDVDRKEFFNCSSESYDAGAKLSRPVSTFKGFTGRVDVELAG